MALITVAHTKESMLCIEVEVLTMTKIILEDICAALKALAVYGNCASKTLPDGVSSPGSSLLLVVG